MTRHPSWFALFAAVVWFACVAHPAVVYANPKDAKETKDGQSKDKQSKELTVAVFPFKVLGNDPKYQHLGEGAAEALINQIIKSKALKIVEESQIDKAINTLARNQTGLFEEESALDVGRMIDARFIVVGSVDVLADKIAITGRVLEVETRQLLTSERIHGNLADAFALYDQFAASLTQRTQQSLAAWATAGDNATADDVAARELVQQAKRLDPKFGGTDLAKAINTYKQAVLRSPNHAIARYALGEALLRAGNYTEAKYNLDKALQLNPKWVPALADLGYIEDKLGGVAAGRDYYRRAIEIDANYARAHFLLAANLFNAGEIDEAQKAAATAKRLGEPRAVDLLSAIDARIAFIRRQSGGAAAEK